MERNAETKIVRTPHGNGVCLASQAGNIAQLLRMCLTPTLGVHFGDNVLTASLAVEIVFKSYHWRCLCPPRKGVHELVVWPPNAQQMALLPPPEFISSDHIF